MQWHFGSQSAQRAGTQAADVRLLLAGCFVWICLLGVVGLLGATGAIDSKFPWVTLLLVVLMIGATAGAFVLFNRGEDQFALRAMPVAQQIAKLEGQGLVERQSFLAHRAFEVEQFEDEGLHYFIELSDGRTLFLSGQYLYDYEPTSDDPELAQPRLFPCTEFVVLRHREAGYVLQIQCAGTVLEPEVVAPPFDCEDFRRGIPQDGTILSDRSYERILAERTRA